MKWKNGALACFMSALMFASPAWAVQDFSHWLAGVKTQALKRGISQEVIDAAFADFNEPIQKIIELDGKQPEGQLSLAQYQRNVVTKDRIKKGRALYQKHRGILEPVAKEYGVPAHYIVALWGIETSYGTYTGGYGVVPALATLAYEGRRARFFRAELLDALQILEDGHIAPSDMKGSWAGAMGQCQFMPSSFKNFAVDGDGDGHKDIWNSLPDVFASMANYLAQNGWAEDERWGRKVILPQGFDTNLIGYKTTMPLEKWRDLGVLTMGGQRIPVARGMKATLLQPDGVGTQAYLLYNNFHVLLKWNRSSYFASSVGLLAEQIAS